MFIKSTFTALFALAAQQVAAQNATAQDVAVLEANFEQAGLVPSLFSTFAPEGILNVAFGGSEITPGQNLAASAVASFPAITVEPLEGAANLGEGNTYTAMMVDADVAGTDIAATNQTFHWLANGATLGADGALDLTAATTVIDYVGPGPLEGTGPHRYVVALVQQEQGFTAPAGVTTFGAYSAQEYLTTSGLGPVVAANFFVVENGQSTVAVSSTSAVDTAAVIATVSSSQASSMSSMASSMSSSMASMASSMGSAAASGAMSTRASATASAAASSAPANSGFVVKANGGWTVGAVIMGAAMGALLI